MTTTIPPEVAELLEAVCGALDSPDSDPVGLIHRMVEVQVRLGGLLAMARIDAEHPDLPPLAPRAMAVAVAALRALGEEDR